MRMNFEEFKKDFNALSNSFDNFSKEYINFADHYIRISFTDSFNDEFDRHMSNSIEKVNDMLLILKQQCQLINEVQQADNNLIEKFK